MLVLTYSLVDYCLRDIITICRIEGRPSTGETSLQFVSASLLLYVREREGWGLCVVCFGEGDRYWVDGLVWLGCVCVRIGGYCVT